MIVFFIVPNHSLKCESCPLFSPQEEIRARKYETASAVSSLSSSISARLASLQSLLNQ